MRDLDAFEEYRRFHPAAMHNSRGEPEFDQSDAKLLLREDVKEGKHKQMSGKDLWNSRNEFRAFPWEVFRRRIIQEDRRRKFCNFLEDKRLEDLGIYRED